MHDTSKLNKIRITINYFTWNLTKSIVVKDSIITLNREFNQKPATRFSNYACVYILFIPLLNELICGSAQNSHLRNGDSGSPLATAFHTIVDFKVTFEVISIWLLKKRS